jgi:hypothetical protein
MFTTIYEIAFNGPRLPQLQQTSRPHLAPGRRGTNHCHCRDDPPPDAEGQVCKVPPLSEI